MNRLETEKYASVKCSGPSLDLSGLLWKNQAVREGAYLLPSSDDTSSGCSKDRIY